MKVVWWILAGATVALASFNKAGNEHSSMSSGVEEEEDDGAAPLGPVNLRRE